MQYKNLRIETNIIEHLGRDLITAPEVAFVELIKNSIDATMAMADKRIQISYYDSLKKINEESLLVPLNAAVYDLLPENCKNCNLFLIEDLGCGMTEKVLEEGFLDIGTEIKKNRKDKDVLLGEKGIGRLATQRLGKVLLVETASAQEPQANVIIMDWNTILSETSLHNIEIPFTKTEKKEKSYTRIWIFDVDELDMINQRISGSLFPDYKEINLNEDLDTAVSFLVSPFEDQNDFSIKFLYNGYEIKSEFSRRYLDLAEAKHSFKISLDENGNVCLKLSLSINPWYVYRTHKSCIKPKSEFVLYKRTYDEYVEFLKRYANRYEKTFNRIVREDEIIDLLSKIEQKKYNYADDNETIRSYFDTKTTKSINELKKILPILGALYTYKKDAASCSVIFDFVKDDDIDIRSLQHFLDKFSGIKLYRGAYRVGFLGNKDNDWLKLQQYRTVGHQFFRFNLGTTLGYVSINDINQNYIKEISSRLDINRNQLAETFLLMMEVVCNYYLFGANETVDILTKEWLADEGWLQGNIKKEIESSKRITSELLKQNKALQKKLQSAKKIIDQSSINDDGVYVFQEEAYDKVSETIDFANQYVEEAEEYIKSNGQLAEKCEARMKRFDIETYNNFKLMANGLITETITHELHSLVSTAGVVDMNSEFNQLTDYLCTNNVSMYNDNLLPIRDTYDTVVDSLHDVANLYKFLESTFIKNNSSEEYEVVNISAMVHQLKSRLADSLDKVSADIRFAGDELNWFLPKGVLLHVLYNLSTNSIFWIGERQKRALTDKSFMTELKDEIVVEGIGMDCVRVYDSGTGVKPEMEEVLFEPLQSGKGPLGRGMGLYIVKQLLKSFNGSIELLPEKNAFGNRYMFEIIVPDECVQRV